VVAGVGRAAVDATRRCLPPPTWTKTTPRTSVTRGGCCWSSPGTRDATAAAAAADDDDDGRYCMHRTKDHDSDHSQHASVTSPVAGADLLLQSPNYFLFTQTPTYISYIETNKA